MGFVVISRGLGCTKRAIREVAIKLNAVQTSRVGSRLRNNREVVAERATILNTEQHPDLAQLCGELGWEDNLHGDGDFALFVSEKCKLCLEAQTISKC